MATKNRQKTLSSFNTAKNTIQNKRLNWRHRVKTPSWTKLIINNELWVPGLAVVFRLVFSRRVGLHWIVRWHLLCFIYDVILLTDDNAVLWATINEKHEVVWRELTGLSGNWRGCPHEREACCAAVTYVSSDCQTRVGIHQADGCRRRHVRLYNTA